MSLTDKTYFNGEINVPDGKYNGLAEAITRYEPEVLKRLLGYELYKLVAAYNASSSPQPIKDLVEGKEYTISDGSTVKWNGLINTDKVSLIAYYVFYYWLRNRATLTTTAAEVKQTGENSTPAINSTKASGAWFRLKELYGYGGQSEYVESAYNFLTKFESDYPTWKFKNIGSVNSFDL